MVHKQPTLCPPIPPRFLAPFLACLIGGYLFHLYAFTNLIPNSDGLNRVYDLQEMTVSGRWFLHYATMPSGFMQMPTFIGLLTLLFLGLSAVLLVDLCHIKHPVLATLAGLSLVTLPSLGYTFLYLFTASAYSIGIFLAVASTWLASKGRWLPGILLLACSMGIYQAYAPISIGLSVILVLKACVDPQETLKSITLFGLKLLGYLATGAATYYLILQLILTATGQELLPYLGMEEANYPFTALPGLIISAYKQVIFFFFLPQTTSTLPLVCANLMVFALGVFALILWLNPLWKEKKQRWRVYSVVILCGLLPLALGFVQIISPWSAPTPLMQFSYGLAYWVVALFLDRGLATLSPQKWQKGLQLSAVAFGLTALCGGWICNLLYTASAQTHRATESYVTRMMSRIESLEGYQQDMPLIIIGEFPQELYHAQIPPYQLIDHYSVPTHTVLPLNKHIYYYLNHWLNIPTQEPSQETMISVSDSPAFQAMPLYPDHGSLQIIEGQVVVRVSTEYLPKSDYELAYEERK